MTINDSSTLGALIKAYENAVIFEESVPTSLRIAKAFSAMGWSSGGLVLLGVREDESIVGIESWEVDWIYDRFEHLCTHLTRMRVEIGTLTLGEKRVVFLVFNTIPRHTEPLGRYTRSIGRVRFF